MNTKIVKIIATSFYFRTIRMNTVLCGNPPVYTLHSQNFTSNKEIEDLILFNIEKENQCNPGLPVDIAFVNNDVGNHEGNKFIEELKNKKLKNGKIIIIQNGNSGWSYGAFNKGFEVLKNNYDYFIFTEDDMIIAKNNYAKISLDTFFNTENCGFVSYGGITSWFEVEGNNENFIHAHGAWGFTSKKILDKIYYKYGSLPHSKHSEKKYYNDVITEGEIKFTNLIFKMGYNLVEPSQKLFEPAYDLMRGIIKPWKPSKFTGLKWLLTNKIRKQSYKLLVFLKLYKLYRSIKTRIFSS